MLYGSGLEEKQELVHRLLDVEMSSGCMLGPRTISVSVLRLRVMCTRAIVVCIVKEASGTMNSALVGRVNKGLSYVALPFLA